MFVGELCVREVVVAPRNASILELSRLMREYHVGDVVIVEDEESPQGRRPLGIVTDRDLVLELIAEEVALDSVVAGDVMGAELVTVKEKDGIWDALQVMRSKGVRRLPVLDHVGCLVGILSADDIFEMLADQMEDLVILIGREQMREQRMRP